MMRLWFHFKSALRNLFRKPQLESQLDDEVRAYVDLATDERVAAGMPATEARRTAIAEFGGIEQVKQAVRDRRTGAGLELLWQDVRYALRQFRRNRAFTLTAVITLALGIGVTTAIFSAASAVLLHALPYGDTTRLVYLFTPNPHVSNIPVEAFGPSYADFFDLKRAMHSVSSMSAFEAQSFNLMANGNAMRVGGARVDGNFFFTLQSMPALGRIIEPADDQPGHGRVVIISYALWQSIFGGKSQILSNSIRLDGALYRVIGVMPKTFGYPHETDLPAGVFGNIPKTDVWIPLELSSERKADRDNFYGTAIARLKPSFSIQQAQSEMSALMVSIDRLHGGDLRSWGALVRPFEVYAIGSARKLMWLLGGAAALVLLVACVNVATLLVVRAAARSHELGIRAALGAARARIVRQLLTESVLLGVAGGCAGIAFAYIFLCGLLYLSPGDIPRLEEATIDLRVLGFAFLVALLTGIIFGLLPAPFASRLNLVSILKTRGSHSVLGSGTRLRSSLVITQIALVVTLLASAGLLLHSYSNVQSVETGFSSSTLSMDIPAGEGNRQKIEPYFRAVLQVVQKIPGVSSVALINAVPLSRQESVSGFFVDGYANQKEQLVKDWFVTPEYFSTMGIPVLEGRHFSDADAARRPLVVIVNQAFVKKYFGTRDPLGLRLRTTGGNHNWRTVVGVVRSVHQVSLEAAPAPEVYEPLWQTDLDTDGGASLVIRSTLPPAQVAAAARNAFKTIDPGRALSHMQTMGDLVTQATAQRRFQTILVSVFAGAAMLLGIVGIYGLLAYSVRQRTSEIGLRIALGASRLHVVVLFLREGLRLAAIGLPFGIAGALAVARLFVSSLYGVSSLDPITFAAVPALLLLVTIAACLVPAIRAAGVDPMNTLHDE
jgi:predicted permease